MNDASEALGSVEYFGFGEVPDASKEFSDRECRWPFYAHSLFAASCTISCLASGIRLSLCTSRGLNGSLHVPRTIASLLKPSETLGRTFVHSGAVIFMTASIDICLTDLVNGLNIVVGFDVGWQ